MSCFLCRWAYNLAHWLDQGLNVLTGGDPRQTVSARLGRAEANGHAWAAVACRWLGVVFRDPAHCATSTKPGDNTLEVVDIDGPSDA